MMIISILIDSTPPSITIRSKRELPGSLDDDDDDSFILIRLHPSSRSVHPVQGTEHFFFCVDEKHVGFSLVQQALKASAHM
jgi:hypothetical protein